MVNKSFESIFSDPGGDALTYTVSVPENRASLVDIVGIHNTKDLVLFEYDGNVDWEAVTPELANPVVTEVPLTATDPDVSVFGVFRPR